VQAPVIKPAAERPASVDAPVLDRGITTALDRIFASCSKVAHSKLWTFAFEFGFHKLPLCRL
jgi:hypothetical protein